MPEIEKQREGKKEQEEKKVEKKVEQPKSVSVKFGLFPKIQELTEEILLPKDKILK